IFRFCIVAAGIIRRERNGIGSEIIENSYKIWQSNLKRKHGHDYHGNFTTELFETWFSKLCETLATKYGPCKIHHDGASYHKNQINPAPTTRTRNADIQEWLVSEEIWNDPSYTKAELLLLVRANKPKPVYQATKIATAYDHLVYFTPLYHPELQPVELIWAHAKNQVADDPASSMPELKAKIDAEFDTVVSDTWINAYEHVQEFEEKYMQQADACELAANAVDNVDGGVRDAEEGDNTEHDGSDVNDED
ncbi:hypothetical protein JG687_00016294, partial [Phytophthora cactorum]